MRAWSRPSWVAALLIVLGGFIYVSQFWSPSSYGVLLRQIGQPDEGLVFGQPRAVRSDEWAVVTPLTQATVHNGFERINKTSLYQEDLRINYGLPIFDWGLVFKPTMWPYLWAHPARAFSFHWYVTLVLFIAGHALLFARLGLSRPAALLLSVGLYFTPFTQFWWNEKGPVMALFPWVVWALLTPWPRFLRLALFYWLGASWLITNFYPPLFLSLAFVGAAILLAFGREWLKPSRFAALAFTAAGAGLTAALYYQDYLRATARTLYPGSRSVAGGSVPWYEWWSVVFPFSTFDRSYESLRGQNICEVAAVGAAFVLVALCCVRYRRLADLLARGSDLRTPLRVLAGGLLLMLAWMALPLPSWVGFPLLWHHVQPERMEYAFGLLLMLLVALAVEKAGLELSRGRMWAYAALVVVGWLGLKGGLEGFNAQPASWHLLVNDLVVLPVLLVCLLAARMGRWRPTDAVLAASAVSGAVVLFGFNPIQSAQPIFAELGAAQKAMLQAERTQGGAGPVAIEGMPGATVNGLGFASVSHVTPVPALGFWRGKYPDMAEPEFQQIFNRYSHLRLGADVRKPTVDQADAVTLPLADFWPDRVLLPAQVGSAPPQPHWLTPGQHWDTSVQAPRAGMLSNIGVFIGTGSGKADGDVQIQVCQAQRCTNASASLAQARDNAFLVLPLTAPWALDERQPLQIRVEQVQSKNAVALWLFAEAAHATASGAPPRGTPRFRLEFQPVSAGQ